MKNAILAKLERVKGPDHKGEYTALCPFHGDHNPSLSSNTPHSLVANGSQSSLRLGHRILIPRRQLDALLAANPVTAAKRVQEKSLLTT